MRFLQFLISRSLWLNLLLMFIILIGIIYWSRGYLNEITHHGEKIKVPYIEDMSITEAQETLAKYKLKIRIDSSKFDEKYAPFQIYKQDPSAGGFVKENRFIGVKANPKTFRPVKLPNLMEQSIRLARQHLSLTSLKIGNITYKPYIAKDVVLEVWYNGQQIQPGQELPRQSTLDLVLGEGYKKHVGVPNLNGLTLREASNLLLQKNLSIGRITKQGVTDSVSAIVFRQFPKEGIMVQSDQLIDLWISNDSEKEQIKN